MILSWNRPKIVKAFCKSAWDNRYEHPKTEYQIDIIESLKLKIWFLINFVSIELISFNEFQIHRYSELALKNGFCGGTLDDVNGIINLSWLTVRGVTVNKRQFANWT